MSTLKYRTGGYHAWPRGPNCGGTCFCQRACLRAKLLPEGVARGQKRSQKASPTAKASSDTIRPEGRALISHSRIFNGDMEFPVYSTPSISLATNSKAKHKIILIWEICTKIGVRKHKIDENEKF